MQGCASVRGHASREQTLEGWCGVHSAKQCKDLLCMNCLLVCHPHPAAAFEGRGEQTLERLLCCAWCTSVQEQHVLFHQCTA
mmetsp:Transcript_1817/g.4647  ORF Transcript_1817/g.4647 Transcript_1817/m.4647 type:complete len:82 (+) Transcript_1817:5978-6223(+)